MVEVKSKGKRNIVVGATLEGAETQVSDPAWLEAVKAKYPTNLTFHALIRELYKINSRKVSERKARAISIIDASKKLFERAEREAILIDLDTGDLRLALELADERIEDGEGDDLESAILESLDD